MLEQLPHRNLVTPRNDTGHVIFERALEPKLPLFNELQHDRRGERLRHASDPKTLIRARLAGARRCGMLLPPVGDENDHAPHPWAGKCLGHLLDRGRRVRRLARRRRRPGAGGSGKPDRHQDGGAQILDSIWAHLVRPPTLRPVG